MRKELFTLLLTMLAMSVSAQDDMLSTPLTFEAISAGTLTIKNPKELTFYYCKNGGASSQVNTTAKNSTNVTNISLSAGDKVTIKGDNASYGASSLSNSTNITCSGDCYIYGNIMSLINSTPSVYKTLKTLSAETTFKFLFENNAHIKNHPIKELLLPATTLTGSCYMCMFESCTGMTTAPDLPAITLKKYCYRSMFSNCTGLTTVPDLPATTLADYCCLGMFNKCSALTTAPDLPATTLAQYCYDEMFYDCTSLTTAPDLPATTLVKGCYKEMFKNCTNLNFVRCLATQLGEDYSKDWLSGVSSTGTFVRSSDANVSDLGEGVSGIPTGWTTLKNCTANFTEELLVGQVGKTYDSPEIQISTDVMKLGNYSSSNTKVAKVDKTTGAVTIKGKGAAIISNTITPKYSSGRYYYPATASYTVVGTENVGGIRCDTNADGKVTITDAVTVVNYILNGSEATAAPALSKPEEVGQVPE